MNKLRRFVSMPLADQFLLLEAFCSVAANRVRLSISPARAIRERRSSPRVRPRLATYQLDRIAGAVRIAGRYVPAATCLTQALALQALLTRHGHASSLHIGVDKGPGRPFGAHAWVRCGDRVMIGGDDSERYAPLLIREERP
ncbi:MAG: lasso peptide biosynthesis B2 protein [Candidatus Binatus sp.]|uniref:lasso peptide biosynthesis B2 protein n=1 Tax=Candidatus Binatus sp. TaxID=2811406 RepID=UPI00272583ED|nr:lasso peptide biosynthesis B2 protein [Candidatus Binatus sp.]MDO8432472.1 lasso peptide biosynthesis B2 protein [Candidatus Binatus sp.]